MSPIDRIVRLMAPARVAGAHEGSHGSGAPVTAARPSTPVRPHVRVHGPLVSLAASAPLADADLVGGRAARLSQLAQRGVMTPPAVAVPATIAAAVVAGEVIATETLALALHRWLDPRGSYAIRPSPLAAADASVDEAGPLEPRRRVAADAVAAAVREVAAHGDGRPRADRRQAAPGPPQPLGVVVQHLVDGHASGVAFSRNPLTGLAETVVEAMSEGVGRLAHEGASPDRWVRRWGAFTESPAKPRVDEHIVLAVATGVSGVAAALGQPVEAEWAHDGQRLWWLEASPLEGIAKLRVYSNRIAREVLPGVIKPLVWSVNVPIVNAAWIRLLEELVGPLDLEPRDLARSFGHHAYFDMSTLGDVFETLDMPRDSLELLLGLPKGPEAPTLRPGPGVLRHISRVPGFLRTNLRRGRWAREEVVTLRAAYREVVRTPPAELDDAALLARIDDLARLTERAAYANITVPLVMHAYGRGLERAVVAVGFDPLDADPTADRADRNAWDPNPALDELAAMAEALPAEVRDALGWDPAAALVERPDLDGFDAALAAFLARFGHLSDSGNDFSVAPWRDDPGHLVRIVLARRGRPGKTSDGLSLSTIEASTPALARPWLRLLWRRAGAFRVYREVVSSTYTWGYGLFRETFLESGRRLLAGRRLDRVDDVFYLELGELRDWLSGDVPTASDSARLIAARRRSVLEAGDLIVPETVYGDAFVPRRRADVVRGRLQGNPTSRGTARGTARVVRSAADFDRVCDGDILVIPYSDAAWTPLFARAGGVVSASGGMLSHSSIVAREYAIPCVVSVEHAIDAIPDGASVVVDGSSGEVLVEAVPDVAV